LDDQEEQEGVVRETTLAVLRKNGVSANPQKDGYNVLLSRDLILWVVSIPPLLDRRTVQALADQFDISIGQFYYPDL
jgi:hypothetical protein